MSKILIIEDDIHFQNILTVLFERNGYDVDAVFDGYDGIEKAEKEIFDIIITDMHMPDTDGLEVIEGIREGPNKKTPIIAISGGDAFRAKDQTKLHQARKTDVHRVFKKPFEHSELLDTVKELLENRKAG